MHPSTNTAWQAFSPSSLINTESEQCFTEKLLSHYQQSLLSQPDALNYLTRGLGLSDPVIMKEFRLGFSDRSFPDTLPPRGTLEGEVSRGLFQRLQLFKGNGHEAYRGMIFVPLFDNNGEFIGSFGQRTAKYPLAVRGDTYWTIQPDIKGQFFNHQVLASFEQVVLCETPFDVMSLYLGGVKNAIALLDFKYFDDSHISQLLEHDINEVTIAFSRTPIGDRYCAHVRNALRSVGIKVNKLEMFVGESVNSIWAKSQRFNILLQEINSNQQSEGESLCTHYYH